MSGSAGRRRTSTVIALAVVGALTHDVVEFGRPSEQNTLPVALVSIGLVVAWHQFPDHRRIAASTLVGFTTGMLILGAGLSVFPLPIWPFEPEQTLAHYLAHVAWGLLTLPLLVFALRLRDGAGAPGSSSE